MNLLVQNMEFDILNNGIKKILICIMCDGVPPHEHNEIGVSLLNIWASRICIEKDHEPWDRGGPIWCIMLKRKCQRSF
jgi:hypothetical protein